MKAIALFMFGCLLFTTAKAQKSRADLYQCEGCEAIFEHSFDDLTSTTTIAASAGEKLVLSGTIFSTDGKTPASNVVLYAYHTDASGRYPTRGDEAGWARRHGYLRGWIKTDEQGRYTIHTIRPAPYPNRRAPAHIHMTIKEPGQPSYWIDEVVFEDDPLVTPAYRQDQEKRGGSGVIHLKRSDAGDWKGVRDIVLERHPETEKDTLRVETGQSVIKWKGTKFWGLGKHEGVVNLNAGALHLESGSIRGGWFEIDMQSIEVTDIPKSDPIPRKRLRDHLMDDDFFAVPSFPTARFVITEAIVEKPGYTTISGDLTIRDQTHPITFQAETPDPSGDKLKAFATLSINRRQWSINFTGSRVTNDLVDDDIHLEILLVCRSLPPVVSKNSDG